MSQSSTWNIWDFHLHTPYSILHNGFGDAEAPETWEKYVSQITSKTQEKGIVALGITDYFTIEGYKKVLELKKSGRLSDIFIFPNIEFRVDKVIHRDKGEHGSKRLNLHVLLSPEIPTSQIEDGFLHDLDFYYEQDPFNSANTRKLKIANLREYGEKLQSQQDSFKSKPSTYIGCMNAVVKTEQIKELLDNKFRGKYLIVLADEDLSDLDWNGQHHGVRKHLVQMSHAVFSSNHRTREFCLGNKHPSPEDFTKEFKSLKPCLWGCDSHSYDERFLEPSNKRYCWVKAEVSWEGLKQVLYEPCDRVRVQTENPETETPKSSFTLENLKIERTKLNDSLTIDEFCVQLNPNLVTIIGGRGSGKTALLDIVASCFGEGEKLSEIKTSFIHRLYAKTEKNKSSVSSIKTFLTFKSGETYEGEIGTNKFLAFERSDVLYLTQNHFEEYSANPEKLNSHIRKLVFDNFPDYRRQYEGEEQKIKQIEQEIQNINLKIEQLDNEVLEKEESLANKLKVKVGDKDDISLRISSIEAQQGQSHSIINDLTDKLEEIKQRKKTIEEILSLLQQFESQISSFNDFYSNHILELNQKMSSLEDSENLKSLPAEVIGLREARHILSENKELLDSFKKKTENDISKKNQDISELEGVGKTIAEFRQKLANLNTEIQETEQEIEDINKKKTQSSELNTKRFNLYIDIMKKMSKMRIFLQKVIDEFENGKDEILNNLKFGAFIDMRRKSECIQQIADKINNNIHPQNEIKHSFNEVFESMENLMNEDLMNEENESIGNRHNDDVFISISQKIENITKDLRLKKSVTKSDYFNTVFQRFFDLGVEISFNNKSIDNLSMGERAIVLLKILLALDDKPLLIDQPEEHLDNRFIFNELVPAFRSAKRRRQIIIATHNANLVVNTDAEQIIIAEQSEGEIKYSCGAIEDLEIRLKITQLLEGGELAFKKREEKYGYKF